MQPRKRTEVGTRKETAKGYIKIYVPDHPNAKDGWEFEHRIVMEKALGRYLLPDETVHHKFGIRSDNKIENLELWIKPQPSGIRVEDAVVWAKRILERYGTK